jgi:predicted Zn-dependent protease
MRWPLVGFAVVIFISLASIGCSTDFGYSVQKLIGWDDAKITDPKYPKASYEIAERVESMGKWIVAQNTFMGINPQFYTVGVPESVLFHRGPEELFISEGLVKLCKSDDELAAVLCSELGKMVAEKRAIRRVGADSDTIPDVGLASGGQVMTGGGTPDDPSRMAELAYQQKRPKLAPTINPDDAAKQARTLLTTAGYNPAALDQVQPLLKQSDRGSILRKQLSGTAPSPTWNP